MVARAAPPPRFIKLAVAAVVGLGLGGVVAAGAAFAIDGANALADPPKSGYPPDPPGLPTTQHWLFDIKVDKGVVSIERVKAVTLKNPEPTPRVMGRYALELWIGSEMLDRLRFNVPLGGDLPREVDGRPFKRPSFDKVTTKLNVRVGDQPRAVYLKLIDRATGDEKRFLWPPTGETLVAMATPDANKADGGAKADGGKTDAGAKDGGAAPSPSGSAKPDAGAPDGGTPDGGSPDGGSPDGGSPDAGDGPLLPRKPGR